MRQRQSNLRRIIRESVRMYFAPLIGAFKGARDELRRVDNEIVERRREEEARERDSMRHA
jgi:transposase